MSTNQAERLGLRGRKRRPPRSAVPWGAPKRRALAHFPEQGETINRLQVLRSLDPAVETLEREGETEPYEETQQPAKGRIPRRLRRGGAGGRKRFLGDLHVVVMKFFEEAQRLCVILESESVLAEPLFRGQLRQLPVHERQRRPEVLPIGALLLVNELVGVGVRDVGRKHRGGRGGRDVDDVRFSLPGYAHAFADRFLGQSTAE